MENFKNFMLPELKEQSDIIAFKGVDTFKDKDGNPIPIKFRVPNRLEVREIRKKFERRTPAIDKDGNFIIKNGAIVHNESFDFDEYTDELIVETMVYPNLNDTQLQEYYGVYAATELLHILFRNKDYKYIDSCCAQVVGFSDLDEQFVIKEVKN